MKKLLIACSAIALLTTGACKKKDTTTTATPSGVITFKYDGKVFTSTANVVATNQPSVNIFGMSADGKLAGDTATYQIVFNLANCYNGVGTYSYPSQNAIIMFANKADTNISDEETSQIGGASTVTFTSASPYKGTFTATVADLGGGSAHQITEGTFTFNQ